MAECVKKMKTAKLLLLEGYRVQRVCQGQRRQGILTNNNQLKTCQCDRGGKGDEVQLGGSAGEVRCAMTFQGDYGYQDDAKSIILSACGAKQQLQRKTTISDCQYCQFMTLVNSASKAPPICLPPKGAKFCHTLNILLVGCWCCRALLQLF